MLGDRSRYQGKCIELVPVNLHRLLLETSCHQLWGNAPHAFQCKTLLTNHSFGVGCHQYTDDICINMSLSKSPGNAVVTLNGCLAAVVNWLKVNKLKQNPEKPKVLLVGKAEFLKVIFVLTWNGVQLTLVG